MAVLTRYFQFASQFLANVTDISWDNPTYMNSTSENYAGFHTLPLATGYSYTTTSIAPSGAAFIQSDATINSAVIRCRGFTGSAAASLVIDLFVNGALLIDVTLPASANAAAVTTVDANVASLGAAALRGVVTLADFWQVPTNGGTFYLPGRSSIALIVNYTNARPTVIDDFRAIRSNRENRTGRL